jgi:hypothetical protein
MFWLERDGFQNQKIERALDEITRFPHTMTIYTRGLQIVNTHWIGGSCKLWTHPGAARRIER